tara:strand:- start:573 stop:749 length:177 start_codon:yes stop_codon:yes gene_type:complete
MEIAFLIIGGVLVLGTLKVFLTLAAFEENKSHSRYLMEEEHHKKMAMLRAHEDPRYFP